MREHKNYPSPLTHALYQSLELLSELLLYGAIIFGPWAFGTVEPWSIRVLNALGYTLGTLLIMKVALRAYQPALGRVTSGRQSLPSWHTRIQVGLTVIVLLFVVIHAWNARATFDSQTQTFSYIHTYIDWLPHSYDRERTLQLLYQGLALACFYWAGRDWLMTSPPSRSRTTLTPRLKRLLVVLTLSGAALGIAAILQRMDGTNKLLWLVEPRIIKYAPWQFGSFAYRGNAAAYFNLVWPLALLLFLALKSESNKKTRPSKTGSGAHIALAPLVAITAICPMITSSRAGAAVFVVQGIAIGIYFLRNQVFGRRQVFAFLFVLGLVGSLTISLGGGRSIERIRETIAAGTKQKGETRLDIFQHFPAMLRSCPWGGYGPGSFSSVYILVRKTKINPHPSIPLSKQQNDSLVLWSAWAHSDPVETLLTFGPIGTAFLLAFLASVMISKGRERHFELRTRRFLLLVSLFGMLLHSVIDFPFQIY